MNIEQHLVEKFGVLMTLDQCAQVLNRTPQGFRITLTRDCEIATKFNAIKLKIGKRVLFKSDGVAKILSGE